VARRAFCSKFANSVKSGCVSRELKVAGIIDGLTTGGVNLPGYGRTGIRNRRLVLRTPGLRLCKNTNRTNNRRTMTKIKKLFRRGQPEELAPLLGFTTVCLSRWRQFRTGGSKAIRAASHECTLCRILIFTFDQLGGLPFEYGGLHFARL